MVLIGAARGWRWVRNPWFRAIHLGMILFVVAQVAFDFACPLTVLERDLRQRAGETPYEEAFIDHWVQRLCPVAPADWVYSAIYVGLGLLVLAIFVLAPPNWRAGPDISPRSSGSAAKRLTR